VLAVGQWASFLLYRGSAGDAEVRLATVATEWHRDTALYWLEVTYRPKKPRASQIIAQVLTPGLPVEPTSIRAVTLQTGTGWVMQVADQTLGMIARRIWEDYPTVETLSSCLTAQVIGWETVTVPGGSFHALHIKGADCEEWLADSVPFGIVKLQSAGGQMALIAHGEGAKSSIVETPRQFPQWLAELAASLASTGGVGSRDSSQRAHAAMAVCDSLFHDNVVQSDAEPSLPPAMLLFMLASGPLPGIEEKPHLIPGGERPKYPKELVRFGAEGRVVMQGIVDTTGSVQRGTLVVMSAPYPGLGVAARQYVERAHFAPGRICGRPIRVLIQIPIDYKIAPRGSQ
jgi:TonB family protein